MDNEIKVILDMMIKKRAYVCPSGSVYLDISIGCPNKELFDAVAGNGLKGEKRNVFDILLWKVSMPNEPGWDSPWGRGVPCISIEGISTTEPTDIQPFYNL